MRVGLCLDDALVQHGRGLFSHPLLVALNRKYEVLLYTPSSIIQEVFEQPDLLVVWGINSNASFFNQEYLHIFRQSLLQFDCPIKNPVESLVNLDKQKQHALPTHFAKPVLYDIKTHDDLKDLTETRKIVVKPKRGSEGLGIHLLDKDSDTKSLSLQEYVFQEYISVLSEKRFMVFADEVQGSRIIYNRQKPWEKKEENLIIKPYQPTTQEKNAALSLHRYCGLCFSAIDTVQDTHGKEYFLEVNTICPGLRSRTYPDEKIIYDLYDAFAESLR